MAVTPIFVDPITRPRRRAVPPASSIRARCRGRGPLARGYRGLEDLLVDLLQPDVESPHGPDAPAGRVLDQIDLHPEPAAHVGVVVEGREQALAGDVERARDEDRSAHDGTFFHKKTAPVPFERERAPAPVSRWYSNGHDRSVGKG